MFSNPARKLYTIIPVLFFLLLFPLFSVQAADPFSAEDADQVLVRIAQLIVDDGQVQSPPDTVVINAEVANTAPVADVGPDQRVALGSRVILDGSASRDADGDPLAYQWSLTALPPGSTLTHGVTLVDGANTFTLEAANALNQTATPNLDTLPPPLPDAALITVSVPNANGHVTVTGGAGSVEGGAEVTLTNTRTG